MSKLEDHIAEIVQTLAKRLRRLPTEDEVMGFIYGDDRSRIAIWNAERGEDYVRWKETLGG